MLGGLPLSILRIILTDTGDFEQAKSEDRAFLLDAYIFVEDHHMPLLTSQIAVQWNHR